MSNGSLALAAFLYGMVCFTVLTAWFLLLPLLFPGVFRESSWTVWKEILHSLACTLAVCFGNIIFTHFYFTVPLGLSLMLRFLWMTFSVSIFPLVLMVLLRQMRLMRTYSRGAKELDKQLPDREMEVDAGGLGAGDEPSEEGLGDFLYAEAADNYLKMYYQGGQKMIRSSLRQLEDEFRGQDRFFRCHRTYLVNLDKVIHISGNAQGYKLRLEGSDQLIPVSRTLNGQIARLVTRPKDLPIRPSDL